MREPARTTGALARLGYQATDRVLTFLRDPVLAALPDGSAEAIGSTPDGDGAILGLLRLAEAAKSSNHGTLIDQLLAQVPQQGTPGNRLIHLLGTSVALGDFLTRHPEVLAHLADVTEPPPGETAVAMLEDVSFLQLRDQLLRCVGADPEATVPVAQVTGREARDALRIAYHSRLVDIAMADVSSSDAAALQPIVSRALSDLAGAALETALAVARASVDNHAKVRMAVVAMGKTGARELNYISDVDVMYVAEPACDQVAESEVVQIGSALARELARVCADRTAEGSLWQVDANLRPEGKDGPLVRTLDSFRRYYAKWAHSWEFQALLKARPVAGDPDLGREFSALVEPLVWQASTREGFVEDTRAMRRRVVDNIPRHEVDRNLKLGPGGLRDVEFTVQMLQMVHGRTDDSIRARTTLVALHQLVDGGYISRDHGKQLDESYRLLRTIEHRLQLHRLRRTQVIPTAESDTRRIARAVGIPPEDFAKTYETTRRRVRQLHEEIYYRPLLQMAAGLPDAQVQLSPEAAQDRLAAIGYRDPRQAINHINALTTGLSRTAQIQRQLLPALLEWFAGGIDPDRGLLAFRRLSEEIGSAHWYMALLRDSGVAAQRLSTVLSSSRFIGDGILAVPEAVRWLAHDSAIKPLSKESLDSEFSAVIRRVATVDEAVHSLRRARQREILRIAMGVVTHQISPMEAARGLTDLAEAVLGGGLLVAYHAVARAEGLITDDVVPSASTDDSGVARPARQHPAEALGIEVGVIAQGSFGAREMGFSSDADVQFFVVDRGAGSETTSRAVAVATQLQKIVNAPSSGADMKLNADLRPEGKNGVLVRTLDSWCDYYQRDALTWEKQALVRARVVCTTPELAEQVTTEIDRHRYAPEALTAGARRDIVRMKARVEGERLPRGADPSRHFKLGRGAMTDVEWAVQLLILEHAHREEQLRTTTTIDALHAAREAGLISEEEQRELSRAWIIAWRLRRALLLWKGREGLVLPTDTIDLRALARLVLGEGGTARGIEEEYLRVTRRARVIAERIIFGTNSG